MEKLSCLKQASKQALVRQTYTLRDAEYWENLETQTGAVSLQKLVKPQNIAIQQEMRLFRRGLSYVPCGWNFG